MTRGQRLLLELERQRRAGDLRLDDGDRAILERVVLGDLAEAFAEALAASSDEDEFLGGGPTGH